jgi:C4-dicarboxylate-specific signal transduction histidine kinase
MRGVTMDISERKEAETALMRTRAELARVTRTVSMGEVAAPIAHEINQPLAAIVTNGEACLRWLSNATNTDKATAIVSSIIRDANRAGEVIRGIRALLTKANREENFWTSIS